MCLVPGEQTLYNSSMRLTTERAERDRDTSEQRLQCNKLEFKKSPDGSKINWKLSMEI